MAQREERITDGSRGRLVLSILVVLLGAVLAVALAPIFDSQTVRNQADLRKVEFGLPVPWLKQNQIKNTRTLPYRARILSVSDNATSIEAGGLAIDLGAALALEGLVVGGVMLINRRRDR